MLAGAFKRSAHLAIQSITRWLAAEPPRHIKNLYPIELNYGTEEYGFYDKYMITLGAFLAISYLFADDSIAETPCPAEIGGYVCRTTDSFHKVFASAGGYSLEIDTKANLSYDATGLGRIHRSEIPTELGLSMPLTEGDSYKLNGGVQRIYGTICAGWESLDGHRYYLSELSEGLSDTLTIWEESDSRVAFAIEYRGNCFNGCHGLKETYNLDKVGLILKVELIDPVVKKIYMRIPLLRTNGTDHSVINPEGQTLVVVLGGHQYRITSDSKVIMDDSRLNKIKT